MNRKSKLICTVCFIFVVTTSLVYLLLPPEDLPVATGGQVRPISVAGEDDPYASSASCQECHQAEYQSWHGSYHRTMTQVAASESVIGDFQNVTAFAYGRRIELRSQGGKYLARMHDPEQAVAAAAEPQDFEIVMTTGSHHMQVYWYATGDGRRVGQLPIVWLKEPGRWVPIDSIFIRPPQTQLGKTKWRWNLTCIKCHVTNGRPRIKSDRQPQADTHVAEFGIACESCHGPGTQHVQSQLSARNANTSNQNTTSQEFPMVHPGELDHERSAEVCGQCHSVSTAVDHQEAVAAHTVGHRYRPGDELAQTRHVFGTGQPRSRHVVDYLQADPTFFADRFWSDGMVRVSGREYNGLVRSACFQKGTMSCLTCHEMHPAEATKDWANDQLAKHDANDACLACHEEYQDAEQLDQHTHHQADSTGSACYNCHMPHTTYGLLKAIRSHEVSSPSTQVTIGTGRPNACNLCHIDKTLTWTADYLLDWYQIPRPAQFTPEQRQYSATLLASLTGDAGERALAVWAMGWSPAMKASRTDWTIPILGQLLDDPYPAVRYLAHRALKAHQGYEDFPFDYLGTEASRDAASVRVYQPWRDQQSTRNQDATLLIAEDGDLQHDQFSRLLGRRDDRIVVLHE